MCMWVCLCMHFGNYTPESVESQVKSEIHVPSWSKYARTCALRKNRRSFIISNVGPNFGLASHFSDVCLRCTSKFYFDTDGLPYDRTTRTTPKYAYACYGCPAVISESTSSLCIIQAVRCMGFQVHSSIYFRSRHLGKCTSLLKN